MGKETSISWTHHTFNPWRGCSKVHDGCKFCYAEREAKRFPKMRGIWGPDGSRVRAADAMWREPLKWNAEAEAAGERRRVFCASLADVFEDWKGRIRNHTGHELWVNLTINGRHIVEPDDGSKGFAFRKRTLSMDDLRADLFELIDRTPWLDWLLVTKRPENIRRMWDYSRKLKGHVSQNEGDGIDAFRPNVWLLTSVSDQETAELFIPRLFESRDLAPVLGASAEPLLGPIDWRRTHRLTARNEQPVPRLIEMLDWIIFGGESGSKEKCRSCNVDWIRQGVDQSRFSDVAAFVKQYGSMPLWPDGRAMGLQDPKGGDPSEWASNMRVREFPAATLRKELCHANA